MPMNSSTAILNHLSFPSQNIETTAGFFEKYLGCAIEHKTKDAWILKHGNVDIVIEKDGTPVQWPQRFHFGFELKTVAEVNDLYQTFKKDGVKLETEVFNNSRGSRFFARSECGILVEVNTRQDMNPELWQNHK